MTASCLVVDLQDNVSLKQKLTHAPIRSALLQPGVKAKLQWLLSFKRAPDLNGNSYIGHNMPSLREDQGKQEETPENMEIENPIRYIVTTPSQEELKSQVESSKAVLIHMNHVWSMMNMLLASFQVDVFAESARDTPYLLIQKR
jgi:hypothetical protein